METVADDLVKPSAISPNESSARSDAAASPAESAVASAGLRVSEVLEAPCLSRARVLAGASGLGRVVRRLNVMEVPDILPWVKPHELLLTTGYPVRDDPAKLVELVAALDDLGLAALAIKLHRYIDEIPAGLLAEADRRGFPIIEFPLDVGFDDVLNEVIGTLLNRQAVQAARSEEVHRVLVSIVLEGGGLSDLAHELATILGGPVLVTTPDGRVQAEAGDPAELARVRGSRLFDPSGRLRVELEPAGTRDDPPGPRAVVAIRPGRVDHGRIITFAAAPICDADVNILERAATVAALAVTKELAVAAVEDKYRADFLRDLLTGRLADPSASIAHAASLDWDLNRPMVVAVAELDPKQAPVVAGGWQLRPAQERFASAWQTVIRAMDPAAPVASFNTEVVVLLGGGPDSDLDALVVELDHQVAGDRGGGRLPFSLGLSRVAMSVAALPLAYEQARTALRIGRRLHGSGARATFDRLGSYRLLALIPDTGELRAYVHDVLGPLAGDTPSADDLRQTLETLLETNCNVALAARALHFHYNTVRYRIDKLERLVGPFTTNAALRLDLALALRVRALRGA